MDLARKQGWDEPVAGGRCHGSVLEKSSALVGGRNARMSNAENLSRFRFVLCMENTLVRGYVTEKIANAFMAGAVPIYYGTDGELTT